MSLQNFPSALQSVLEILLDRGNVLRVDAGVLPDEKLGVSVHAGVQAEADGAPDGLGHLALIRRPQARVGGPLYPAVGRHEFRDDGEVLFGIISILSICSFFSSYANLPK